MNKVFVDATSVAEAIATLAENGPEVTILAGGTDLMVQYLRADIQPTILLHVRRPEELKGIRYGTRTEIGAVTTHWQISCDPRLCDTHPALVEAASTVGGRQTQNVGTLAGNVVNASPAADLLPALLVSEATLTLRNPSGLRELTIDDFVIGRRATQRKPDELVTKLSLEPVGALTGETYLKIGRRGAMEVAIVGLAVRLTFDEEGTVIDARVAVCSVAPRALRARDAEQRLVGTKLDNQTLLEASELLRRSATPIDDSRASASYRSRLLAPLLKRGVLACRERAGIRA